MDFSKTTVKYGAVPLEFQLTIAHTLDELADPATLMQSAETLARSVMPNSPKAIEAFLRLAAVEDASMTARNKLEEECLAACWDPEEFKRTLATLGGASRPK